MAAQSPERLGGGALEAADQEVTGTPIRAFFGVPVPEPQREQLGAFLAQCAIVAPEFRWAVTENLHLTVRFVGTVERSLVERIADRLEATGGPAIQLSLGEAGTFKRSRLARVVWLGLRSGADELKALALRVESECRAAGLPPEARAFKPHLTLARARSRDGASQPALPPLPALEPWRVDELILYWSHLKKNGAEHEPIRRIRLG
ncbi:MAG TPA: RNA 2',3'-cyclic phosphodiesterase [Candidatus Dormibacteraeota bacterium]|nr:RNA 2',3'-cyclic phosphodiesterase [Candidatus Dormibacteraeota bacterium]